MKKYISLMAILLAFTYHVSAQVQTVDGKLSFGDRISNAAERVKDDVTVFGEKISDTFGLENRKSLLSIGGVKYMPLYSVNIYNGDDANAFRAECQNRFHERYPNAVITSSACPQKDWMVTVVKNHGQVIGFLETMYCYVIAYDADGVYYMNAKFAFHRFKEIGADTRNIEESWPEWIRTDVMTRKVYAKLLSK